MIKAHDSVIQVPVGKLFDKGHPAGDPSLERLRTSLARQLLKVHKPPQSWHQ